MKHSELRQIIMEEIEAAIAEDNMKKGRRFIPTVIPFPKSIRDQFPEHFKLVKNAEGEYKLYISPMMKVSLEGIQRGRTSQDTRSRAGDLVNKLSEKIPTSVRAILKNFSPKLNTSVGEKGMYPVNSKISDVTNGDINFFNPSNPATSDKAYDPIISEEEDSELEKMDMGSYRKKSLPSYDSKEVNKAMSNIHQNISVALILAKKLKNNGIKNPEDISIIITNLEKAENDLEYVRGKESYMK
jgi:hypothetical protein